MQCWLRQSKPARWVATFRQLLEMRLASGCMTAFSAYTTQAACAHVTRYGNLRMDLGWLGA